MSRKLRDPSWIPPKWELADVDAFKALAKGEANADQQTRALEWIVQKAAGTYDMPFRSDADGGERDTSFALGRMFVGQQIVKLVNMPAGIVAKARKSDGK